MLWLGCTFQQAYLSGWCSSIGSVPKFQMLAHLIHLNKKNSEDGGVTPAGVKVRIVE